MKEKTRKRSQSLRISGRFLLGYLRKAVSLVGGKSQSLRISGRFLSRPPGMWIGSGSRGRNPFGSQVDFFRKIETRFNDHVNKVAIPSDLRSISLRLVSLRKALTRCCSRNPFGSQVDFFKEQDNTKIVIESRGRNPFGSQVDFFRKITYSKTKKAQCVAIPSDLRSISFND